MMRDDILEMFKGKTKNGILSYTQKDKAMDLKLIPHTVHLTLTFSERNT